MRRQEQLEKELEDEHTRTKSSIQVINRTVKLCARMHARWPRTHAHPSAQTDAQVTDGTVFKLRDVEREMEQLRHELAEGEESRGSLGITAGGRAGPAALSICGV